PPPLPCYCRRRGHRPPLHRSFTLSLCFEASARTMDAMDRPTPGGSARPVRAPIFPVAPLNPIRLVSHLMGRGRSTAAGLRGEPRMLPVKDQRGVPPEPSLGTCVPSDEREQKSASTGAHRGPATGRRSLHRDHESPPPFPLPELSHHDELPARICMRGPVVLLVTLAAVASAMTPAPAQDLTQVFKNVSPSVVVIRTREKEVSDEGQLTKFGEVGSGVLISQDGKVMTAAHVVHLADKITVEFLGGESVGARVIASEPDADVSLLKLDTLPQGALVATLGDSDKVQIGEQILIIVAPYGTGHTLSADHISGRHEPDTVDHHLARVLNLPQPNGLLVQRVADDSAAAKLGIRGGTMKATIAGTDLILGGDIILESAGIQVVDMVSRQKIRDRLAHLKSGDPIRV